VAGRPDEGRQEILLKPGIRAAAISRRRRHGRNHFCLGVAAESWH